MNLQGKIVLIDKDEFEKEFFSEILKIMQLSVEVKHFIRPQEGLQYLRETNDKIFVVISLIDFGPVHMNGLELKRKINEDVHLLLKAVLFVFMTYLTDKRTIEEAYKLNIQGYFKKPTALEDTRKLLFTLFEYWTCNLRPDEAL